MHCNILESLKNIDLNVMITIVFIRMDVINIFE